MLYQAKALANGQILRWKQAAQTAGFCSHCIQQITGDVPVRQRLTSWAPALSSS